MAKSTHKQIAPSSDDPLLPGLRLVRAHGDGIAETAERRLHFVTTDRPTSCPHCACAHLVSHGAREQEITDTPQAGLPTVLVIQRRRWRCKSCGKITSDLLHDICEKRKITDRLQKYICLKSLEKPFKDVAQDVGLSDVTTRTVFFEMAEELEQKLCAEAGPVLGLSTLTIGGVPCVLLADLDHGHPIAILQHTSGRELVRWLRAWPQASSVKYLVCWPEEGLDEIARIVLHKAAPRVPRAELYQLALHAVYRGLVYSSEARNSAWERGGDGRTLRDITRADANSNYIWGALRELPLSASSLPALHAALPDYIDFLEETEDFVLSFHQKFFYLWPDVAGAETLTRVEDCLSLFARKLLGTHDEILIELEEQTLAIRALQKQPILERLTKDAAELSAEFNKAGAGYSLKALCHKIIFSQWFRSDLRKNKAR